MSALLFGGSARADLVDDLARTAEVIDVKLSPLGDFLAVLKEQDAQRVVAVFEFPGMRLVNLVDFPGRSEVANFWWVNSERLLFTVSLDWGNRADDLGYGQLYAVDATGQDGKYLDVVRASSSDKAVDDDTGPTKAFVSATLATELWEDPEHVLISTRDFSDGNDAIPSVARLNIYSGGQTEALPKPQPNTLLVDPDPEAAEEIRGLQQMFNDAEPIVVSASRDNSLAIVRLVQDSRTPEFYLFDRDAGQLRLLFDAMPWVNDELLSAMQAVSIPARDGVSLSGYLSLPNGVEGKDLPLVVIPHARDVHLRFSRARFVAAAGYATLQLNPRAARDDLSDAASWAIEQRVADARRICVFGWGGGGQAAIMAVIRDPQLYQCAIAGAGVYAERQAFTGAGSPLAYADKVITPLLLVHGDDDQLAPIEHVYAFQQAVEAAQGPVPELVLLKDAPHYPRSEEHVRQWYRRSIEFFSQHLGAAAKPKPLRTLLIAEPPIP